MLKYLADEDLDHDILRGLERREPALDITSVQEARQFRIPDPEILSWAAREERIVLTHDKRTMPRFASDRVRAGLRMPGLFVVHRDAPMSYVIEDLLIAAICSNDGEWEGQVVFFPFPRVLK